jgi:aminopeptidase N
MTSMTSPTPLPVNFVRPDIDSYRLPDWIEPIQYKLVVEPDFLTFAIYGQVDILFSLTNVSTDMIVLHVYDLNITSARYSAGHQTDVDVASITYYTGDDDHNYAVLLLRSIVDDRVTLSMNYTGELSSDLGGFYRSSFVNANGSQEWIGVTQFEATSARRAFPCFDEPAKKAVFSVQLNVDTVDDATPPYANTNQSITTVLSNTEKLRTVSARSLHLANTSIVGHVFGDTPRMSTYLLAFFVGSFESVQADSSCGAGNSSAGTRIQIYSTPQTIAQNQTWFAANVARCVLDFYNQFFDIAFPLPKVRVVVVLRSRHSHYYASSVGSSCCA